jgi:hypothetical protein
VRVGIKTIEEQVEIYLTLIEITLKTKEEFEAEIHPQSLNKYQCRYCEIVHHLITLTLDTVKIPKTAISIRQLYSDLIMEHIDRKIIIKKHLLEMLMNWENHDIIKQAE